MEVENVVPEKSPNDDREYQVIQLPNQLKLVFVHDPKAEKAACSVSVGVGSLKDGESSLGLAHFLQHMLFMGSRKFPKYNEYSEFMSLNSGYDNAYTSDDETNYHFQISNSNFIPAVQRLSDFFVKALLTSSCIQKQRQAVHEECMLRFGEDNSRKWQILKHFASGPYHNHSIGNNSTLSHPKVEEDLVNFYNSEYSANRITAVLLSAMPISEMKSQLLPFFEEIQNKNLKEIDYQTHFEKEKIGKFVKMQAIKDEVLMEFFWVADSVRPFYQWHPERYVTHVIGHEGKNSLLSLLKAKDWASKMVSYSHDLPKQTIFGLEVHLTENGEESYESVYHLVTEYVASLKAEKHIFDEIKEAAAVEFQFKQKGSNIRYATTLSENLHRIPMNEILSWKSKYNEFKPEIIDNFLHTLKPQNVIVVYSCAEQLQNPITEKHLGGKFIVEQLPKIKKTGQQFEPLVKNPFLPLNTDLVKSEIKVPTKQNGIWFVQGDFGVCKGGIRLKVHQSQSNIFLEFYADYLDLLLKEVTYEAETLKIQVEIDYENEFTLDVFGFSHTVQKLIEEISPMMTSAHRTPLGEKLFNLALESLQEEYHNFYEGEVDEITEQILDIATKSTGISIEDRIKELQTYKYKSIIKKIDKFWKTAQMEWIVVGNFDKENITKLLKNFQKTQGSDFTSQKQSISCIQLKKGSPVTNITYLQSEDIGTSSVLMYKEIGLYDELKYYTLFLLDNYIKTPFFDKLRTEQQLAYYLSAHKINTRGVLALNFLLISSNTNPKEISGHITNFINDFLAKSVEDLTEDKFETLKKSVRSQILKPFQSLQDYYKFVIKEIDNGNYCFDRKTNSAQLQGYLSQIKKEDLVKMLRECLDFNLQIWVVSEPHKVDFLKTKITGQTLQQIKANHDFYKDLTLREPSK